MVMKFEHKQDYKIIYNFCIHYNYSKHHLHHENNFMWLFSSKLHETFPLVKMDACWCNVHELSMFNITIV